MGALKYKEEYTCRARATETGEWMYGNFVEMVVDSRQTAYIYPFPKNANSGNHAYTPQPVECDLETVGRYTGSKDFNGDRIYEGDWVELPNGQQGKVVFECSSWIVYVSEWIDYDSLEEQAPGATNFIYNDNCVSFLELQDAFNLENDSYIYALCIVDGLDGEVSEGFKEAWKRCEGDDGE